MAIEQYSRLASFIMKSRVPKAIPGKTQSRRVVLRSRRRVDIASRRRAEGEHQAPNVISFPRRQARWRQTTRGDKRARRCLERDDICVLVGMLLTMNHLRAWCICRSRHHELAEDVQSTPPSVTDMRVVAVECICCCCVDVVCRCGGVSESHRPVLRVELIAVCFSPNRWC